MHDDDNKRDGDGDDESDDPAFDAWLAADYPTDNEDHAELVADSLPERDEVGDTLTRYFVGPITEEAITHAYTEFLQAFYDESSRPFYKDQFRGRFNGRGDAWREELSHNHAFARPIDLVVLIAQMESKTDPSRPQPRKYCPTEFAGTWEQFEPAPASDERVLWHFLADGTFRSNTKDTFPDRVEWWVERHYDNSCTIVLGEGGEWSGWRLKSGQPPTDEIVGFYLGQHENTRFRLLRVNA
ncbi:MAG: hypothetical protein WKG01_15785 [Kofleriaceae bacterium]